jgi:hypothetical protein
MWIKLTEEGRDFMVNTENIQWFSRGDKETVLCIDGEISGCDESFEKVKELVCD